MKRVLTILAILLLPLSVWAMTPVSDSDLSNVSGQAGVNINADLTMNVSIGAMAWGDNDGVGGTYSPWGSCTDGGYVGITDFALNNLIVRARTRDSYNSYSTFLLKPITIDVATAPAGDFATTNYTMTGTSVHTIAEGTTFVRIGLGALEVSFEQLQFDVALGTHASSGYIGTAPELNQVLGTVTIGGVAVYINPWSYVDIYNSQYASEVGVTFAFNIILDAVKVPYMSWGDGDGLASNATTPTGTGYPAGFKWISSVNDAGYIGLSNFQLGNDTAPGVIITGTVNIDILTDNGSGTYSCLPPAMAALKPIMAAEGFDPTSYADVVEFIHEQGIPDGTPMGAVLAMINSATGLSIAAKPYTMVHISFPEKLSVEVASMWGDVVLSDVAHLGYMDGEPGFTDAGVVDQLGDIYIEGLNFSINAGSWVDIWAQ